MPALEDLVSGNMDEIGLLSEHRGCLLHYMKRMKKKDYPTYEHCLRVGLKGLEVADCLGLSRRVLFVSGIFHDIGKILISDKILKKVEMFTDEDYREIKNHPLYGYCMIKDKMPLAAEIIVRHHRFGENPYPASLPVSKVSLSEKTNRFITGYAKILSIIDFHDAIMTRENEDPCCVHGIHEKKRIMLEKNKGMADTVSRLYDEGIFGKVCK